MIMAKKQSKQRTASSQETDRSNLGTQPQSITVNFPPEHNDSEGRFEKFVNRHHSFFFCVVMAIIIVTYGVFLGPKNELYIAMPKSNSKRETVSMLLLSNL